MSQGQTHGPDPRRGDILLLAAWAGLATGLLEGAALLVFQETAWLSWNQGLLSVTREILWISPVFTGAFFVTAGVLLAGLAAAIPRWPWMRVASFVLAFLAYFDLLSVPGTGRVRHSALVVLALGLASLTSGWLFRKEEAGMRLVRRTLPLLVLMVVLLFAGIEGSAWWSARQAEAALPPALPGTPNVLVVVFDALRADHVSAYGYARATSPGVDRVAAAGVLFENAHSTSSWTLPSHASLLTGRATYEHGAEKHALDHRWRTLGEALQQRGYRTLGVSANTYFFVRRWGFGAGFHRFEDYFHSWKSMLLRTLYGRKLEQFVFYRVGDRDIFDRKRAPEVNRSVLRWLDRDAARPFFAFLNYYDLHDPYVPPQPHRSRFSKHPRPGGVLNGFAKLTRKALTAEVVQSEMDAYDGGLTYADEHFGQLLEELRRRGKLDNTIMVLTADHGESFGERGEFIHGTSLHHELLHVPLILSWPGKIPAGARVAQPVTNAALPATVMDLIAPSATAEFPGPPLTALWKSSQTSAEWPPVFAELGIEGPMRALITREWHYIEDDRTGPELYDRAKDPQQKTNLAATPEGHPVTAEFAAKMKALLASLQKAAPKGPALEKGK